MLDAFVDGPRLGGEGVDGNLIRRHSGGNGEAVRASGGFSQHDGARHPLQQMLLRVIDDFILQTLSCHPSELVDGHAHTGQ